MFRQALPVPWASLGTVEFLLDDEQGSTLHLCANPFQLFPWKEGRKDNHRQGMMLWVTKGSLGDGKQRADSSRSRGLGAEG